MFSNKRGGRRLNQRVEIKLGFRTKAHEKSLVLAFFLLSGLFSFPAIIFQGV